MDQIKVIGILMIKNEANIIRRCIENMVKFVDAVYISDTGSTDHTIDIVNQIVSNLDIPGEIASEPWKNFGQNRTRSFEGAVAFCEQIGWNVHCTYGLLLDADMVLEVLDPSIKSTLVHKGYTVLQGERDKFEYANVRLINLGYLWKCVGVTHEYWAGEIAGAIDRDALFIGDIGDGGSKGDKFTRDMQLLEQGLEAEPTNTRYMFYLANTYRDLGKSAQAIDMYKKRIAQGGWVDECWYCMYRMSCIYHDLNDLTEMEYWANKAYEYHPSRAENIYLLTKVFRERSLHHKAWHYMKMGMSIPMPNDGLFLEKSPYHYLFKYEKTILNFYVEPQNKGTALRDAIDYMNAYHFADQGLADMCRTNMQYYVEPIKASCEYLNYKPMGNFRASSVSFVKNELGYLMNVRYVNYYIDHDGTYKTRDDANVRTRHFMLQTDRHFHALGPMEELSIHASPNQVHETHVRGLEDVRLHKECDGTISWVGASYEYSHDGNMGQILGQLDLQTNTFVNLVSMKTIVPRHCEKNWISLGSGDFIYEWHPFTLGKLENDTLVVTKTMETPFIFKDIRGSTNVCEYECHYYCLTHMCVFTPMRKYYHILMKLSKSDFTPIAYSHPFYFKNNDIEYVLSIDIDHGQLITIFSQRDANPMLATIDMGSFEFIQI